MKRVPHSGLLAASGLCTALLIAAWGILRSPLNAFDDAFITYRYADNLRTGLGLVYNPGEWVLGTTAPLYAVLLAALSRIGPSIEVCAHWVSIGAWIVGAWAALGLLWQQQRRMAGAAAAILIAMLPAMIPALGMETAFLVAVLLLASWAWMNNKGVLAAILSAIAILARQDAALLIALLILARSVTRRRILWREVLLLLGAVLPWFVFAFSRYGTLLPNSVLAKVNQNEFMAVGGSNGFLDQLMLYLGDGAPHVAVATSASILAGLYVIFWRAREWWWLPIWLVLYVAIYIGLGVAPFPWYFIPPWIGAILLAAIGVGHLLGDCGAGSGQAWGLRAARGVLALSCLAALGSSYAGRSVAAATSDAPGHLPEYRSVGSWMAAHTAETDRVATIEIGVIGRLSRRPILDTMGLVSPEMRGHLLGWTETLVYALAQIEPDYAVALTQTAWDGITPQWWFMERYQPVVTFGRATIYQRQAPASAPAFTVEERTGFAAGFAITGLEAPVQDIKPGDTLEVLLHVEVERGFLNDCQINIILSDSATFERAGIAADRPFGGGYSCSAWQPGDSLRIPLRIGVPQEIVPGAYRLGFEVVNLAEGTFYTLSSDPAAKEVQLGWFRVGSPERWPAGVAAGSPAAAWDEGVGLVEATVPDAPLIAGHILPVRLVWQARRTPTRDLTVFIHLVDSAGNIVAQSDRRPFGGRFPTPVWRPGEMLKDELSIPVPGQIAPGEYRIRIGLYDRAGRLPLEGGATDFFELDRELLVEGN